MPEIVPHLMVFGANTQRYSHVKYYYKGNIIDAQYQLSPYDLLFSIYNSSSIHFDLLTILDRYIESDLLKIQNYIQEGKVRDALYLFKQYPDLMNAVFSDGTQPLDVVTRYSHEIKQYLLDHGVKTPPFRRGL